MINYYFNKEVKKIKKIVHFNNQKNLKKLCPKFIMNFIF